MRLITLGATVALVFGSSVVAQQGAHEHGIAELRVAVDGATVLIEFDSPLDNLVGFEHAPRTQAQRDALAAAEVRLNQFEGLFMPSAQAACVLAEAQVESPYPRTAAARGAGYGDARHDDGEHRDASEHAQDHRHERSHADMYAVYQLECANPDALREITLGLFEAFPHLRSVRAETATAKGQDSVRLDKASMRLPL